MFWGNNQNTVVPINYEAQWFKFTIHITEGNKPNLLQRDRLSKLCFKCGELFSLNCESETNLDNSPDEFKDIFSTELGTMRNKKAKMYLNPNRIPRFLKARPVTYALKQKNRIRIRIKIRIRI